MNDFDDQLRADLGAAAAHHQLPSRGLQAIMSEGQRRSQRRTTRTVIGGAFAVVALVVGSVAYLTRPGTSTVSTGVSDDVGSSPDEDTTAGPDTGSSVPPSSSMTIAPSSLTWNAVDVGSSEALTFGAAPGLRLDDGSFLQVSSAPGHAPTPRRTLWRSEDGFSWTQAGEVPVSVLMGSGLVAGSDSRIYAVGTAPSESAGRGTGGDPVAVVSSDGGTSWDQLDLPLDTAALEAMRGVSNVLVQMWVADGPAGTILAVQPFAYPDLSELVPGATNDTPYSLTADGMDLLSQAEVCSGGTTGTAPGSAPTPDETTTMVCTNPSEASYRWDDLDIAPEARPYFGGRRVLLFRIGDDGAAAALAPIDLDEWTTVTDVRGTGSAYLVVGSHMADDGVGFVTFTATSSDAATWTFSEDGATLGRGAQVLWGDRLVSLSFDAAGRPMLSTFDAATAAWSDVALTPLLDQLEGGSVVTGLDGSAQAVQLAAGDAGLSLLVGLTSDQPQPAAGADATVPTGATTTTPERPVATSYVVLRSTDLSTWSVEQIPELAEPGSADQLAVRLESLDGKVVVEVKRYQAPPGTPDDTTATTFWIGTPTS